MNPRENEHHNDSGGFWMVWNPLGRAPVVRHKSEQMAQTEAARLARLVPGQTFIVLEAKYAMRVSEPPVQRVELSELQNDDGIPF